MLESWLDESNLDEWLAILSGYVAYDLDPSDIDAVRSGVATSDGERGIYFSYQLAGEATFHLQLALDPGTAVVRVRVSGPASLMPRVEAATDICAEYRLSQ